MDNWDENMSEEDLFKLEQMEGYVISLIEHMDAHKATPFKIVEFLIEAGFDRPYAIELYRRGTHGWTLPTDKKKD